MIFPAVERILRDTMGLSVPTVGAGGIDRAVQRRMNACDCATEAEYVRKIQAGGQELQQLVEDVVIPETWFFRDPEAYGALADWVAREWLPARAGETLRILSVPCSTGEEPYSIAMLLIGLGMARGAFLIDAVDISAANLSVAASGIYGANSFRKSRAGFQQRYFHDTGAGHRIDDGVRAPVVFRRGNLLDPAPAGPADAYHVIFCRNLLIYFDRISQRRAMERLDGGLAPDGLLFLGSAEMFLARELRYRPIDHAMSFAYRKPPSGGGLAPVEPEVAAVIRSSPGHDPFPPVAGPRQSRGGPVPSPPAPPPAQASPADEGSRFDHARALADAGDLNGARLVCDALLASQGASADVYFLLGLIADGQSEPERASECYRKALYLDPRHDGALAHMAAVANGRGDSARAGRLLDRASRPRDNPESSKPVARSGGGR